jgi:hypothetical protein
MHYQGIFGKLGFVLFTVVSILTNACSPARPSRPPMIPVLSQEDSGTVRLRRPEDGFDARQARALATFLKSEILDREFLYGVDIQNSSLGEGQDLLPAMTLGHFKAKFQIAADRLLLVAETSHLFISKINHPERLIYEWTIFSSDEDHVTIALDRPSPILATLVAGPEAPKERNSWLRSAEFVKADNLLLLQTSIETQKGEVIEFLESVFPREALVTEERRKDSTLGSPLYMNAELEPLSARFGFLSSVLVYFDGEKDSRLGSMVANRFAWSATGSDGPIEWHVTRNLPDELLPIIEAGVEGWNRYSQEMWGKDILRFAGKLPAGIHLGDPRYNVIYWDTVNEAGAAYETQSADPETGLQSHSLIYLPRAWIRMGEEAHRKSFPSEIRSGERTLLGQKIRARCLRQASDRPRVMMESIEGVSPEVFGKELLKQTLLHEVGHALGMDHNFKGSLAFDPDQADSMPTHSVMDYNDFFIERSVFESVESADGPILEYDRQILSALYNQAKDVSASDPVLPTCNDADADRLLVDGFTAADPLCNRYDLGKDPSGTLLRTLQLLSEPASRMGPVLSLPAALERYRSRLAPRLAELATKSPEAFRTREQVLAVLQQAWSTATQLQAQYLSSGHESLLGNLGAVRKSLLSYRESPAHESEFRARVMSTLSFAALLHELPAEAVRAREAFAELLQQWAAQTPWALGQANPTESASALAAEAMPPQDFSAVRATALRFLTLPAGASMHYSKTDGEELDIELWAITILATSATNMKEPATVRRSAAAALASYAATQAGASWILRVRQTLQQELTQARSTRQREELRQMLALLPASG